MLTDEFAEDESNQFAHVHARDHLLKSTKYQEEMVNKSLNSLFNDEFRNRKSLKPMGFDAT